MNIKIIWLAGIFLLALGMIFVACEAPDQPVYDEDNPDPWPTGKDPAVLTSISPQDGYLKDVITLNGNGFSTSLDGNVVSFGGKIGIVISATETELQVIAPVISDQAVKVTVAVRGSEFWSNELDFTFNLAVEVIDDETAWPNGVDADNDGNVYFGSADEGVIYRRTPDGDKSEFAEVPVNGAIHFGPDGYLYVCEQGEGKIVRISSDGGTIEDVVEVGDPIDFDWDADGNMYIVSNWSGIFKLDGSSNLTQVAEVDNSKCIRIFGNTLYNTDIWNGTILKFDITASGLENEEAVYEGDSPLGVDVDVEGTMYFTEAWETTIYTIAQDGSEEALFEGELTTPMHYLSLKDKFLYAVYPGWNGTGEVWKVYVGREEAPRYGP